MSPPSPLPVFFSFFFFFSFYQSSPEQSTHSTSSNPPPSVRPSERRRQSRSPATRSGRLRADGARGRRDKPLPCRASPAAGHGGSGGPDPTILPSTVITHHTEQTACAGSLCRTPTKGGRRRDPPTPPDPCQPLPSAGPLAKRAINQGDRDRLWTGVGMETPCTPAMNPFSSAAPPEYQNMGGVPLLSRGDLSPLPLGTGAQPTRAPREGQDAHPPLSYPPVTAY